MATTFGGSRLANLRDKRTSAEENVIKSDTLKLSMPDESDKVSYEPSASYNPGRSQTRLLRGRIDRTSQLENKPKNEGGSSQGLRLVLNDDPPQRQEERKNTGDSSAMRSTLKRILVSKESQKEREPEPVVEQPKPQTVPDQQPERPILSHDQKPIQEEDVEESLPQAECDLVECPEGCGRKFNRKALEKHAKACKLVFMSKRKEFNSEAKRFVNKQQEKMVKDKKAKEKKEGRNKAKGFEKTSDNWKTASEGFRAAIKAIKKDGEDEAEEGQEEEEEMKIVTCQYCDKPFAEVFMQKHVETCGRRREAEKKKTVKKK